MTRREFRKMSPAGCIAVVCDQGMRIARDADWTPKMRATEDTQPQVLHRQPSFPPLQSAKRSFAVSLPCLNLSLPCFPLHLLFKAAKGLGISCAAKVPHSSTFVDLIIWELD